MAISTCVFDAYGTLFDVNAAARAVASEPRRESFAEVWPQVSANWRAKQLQYTWLRAVTGDHCDFWQVTQDGLDWALEAVGLSGEAELRAQLLGLYRNLEAYAEVPAMLSALKGKGLKTAILSNGSPDMLQGAVDSAAIGPSLDDILSVESVGVFKPSPKVYDLVEARFPVARDEVLFVSSNGWDAGCAAAYGFTTLWVNRAGEPMDRLHGTPSHVASDLTGVPNLVGEL